MLSAIKKSRILVLVVFVALAALTACSGSDGDSNQTKSGSGEPVRGGTLVYADVKPVLNAQTQIANYYEVNNVLNSMLDRLLYFDKKTGEIVPWIAESYTSNSEATEYTFVIRDGVTFSDGSPLDAAAVKANLDLQAAGDASKQIPANPTFVGYESSTVSGNSVTVRLSAPNSYFPRAVTNVQAALVSPGTLKLDTAAQSSLKTIVGSGPFVFESEVPEQEIVLKRRADYAWAPKSFRNQGAAYLDKVVIRVLPEVGLRAGALQSKQVDVVRNIQPVDEERLAQADFQIIPVTAPDLTADAITLRPSAGSPLSDVRVRKALQLGLDREALHAAVLSDSYKVSESILSHEAPGFVDLGDELKFDPKRAGALLDEAGWKMGKDNVRVKDGKQLKVTVSASTSSVVSKPAMEFAEQQWRDIGVLLNNRAGDNAFYTEAYGNPEVAGLQLIKQFYFYAGLGPIFGKGNPTKSLADAALDELFRAELGAVKQEEQKRLAGLQQRKLVVEDALVIPIWDEVLVHGASAAVHIEFTSAAAPIFHGAWAD